MSRSIQKHVTAVVTVTILFFFLICFIAVIFCAYLRGNTYRADLADAAGEFAALTIDADAAKDYLTLRQTDEAYQEVLRTLKAYQSGSDGRVARISLISFSNSGGSYIYDTEGAALGTRLDYDAYLSTVRTELINGRERWTNREGSTFTLYRPVRTVDDRLAGYLVITVCDVTRQGYVTVLIGIAAGTALLGLFLVFLMMHHLSKHMFQPIRSFTDAALQYGGDAETDLDALFGSKRSDEIGQLGQAIRKMFMELSAGAENLSVAVYDANHDGMTQMLNKRYYAAMEPHFHTCESLCAIYFDVNNLKLMNDTLGHEKGDLVIKRAADYIRGFMTPSDYCFRMGGDEFLLIMTGCSLRTIAALVERLDADAPYILNRDSDPVHCALSYGYAYAKGSFSYDAILGEAEKNMYAKKAELKSLMQMPDR